MRKRLNLLLIRRSILHKYILLIIFGLFGMLLILKNNCIQVQVDNKQSKVNAMDLIHKTSHEPSEYKKIPNTAAASDDVELCIGNDFNSDVEQNSPQHNQTVSKLKEFYFNGKEKRVPWQALPNGALLNDAPAASIGAVWPQPYILKQHNTVTFLLNATTFHFEISADFPDGECDILSPAVNRYIKEIWQLQTHAQLIRCQSLGHMNKPNIRDIPLLHNVALHLKQACNGQYPSSTMDESYELSITTSRSSIRASQIWGLLKGLESFYQLLYVTNGLIYVKSCDMIDRPEYRYRGLHLDTARHFIPIEYIKQNMDAMAQNKMNVFHWHIIDDTSFPFKSKQFPELWKKGAFASDKVYSIEEIGDVIEYARNRGIRVIPEFDTPGHSSSWSKTAGIHLYCGEKYPGMIDITNPATYDILKPLFTEVRSVFKDETLHIGGDEIPLICLYWNDKTKKVLQDYTHQEILQEYFRSLSDMLWSIDPEWKLIFWEELITRFNITLENKKTMVQLWLNINGSSIAAKKGHKMISSTCWYLDDVTKTWGSLYDCRPMGNDITSGGFANFHLEGGEACMWTEYVDKTNVMQTIWPRAIAVAERLWRDPRYNHEQKQIPNRFQEQMCRMARRGITLSPVTGAGHCV